MCVCVWVHKCKLSLAGKVLCNLWRAMCVRSHVITSYTHTNWRTQAHALLYFLSLSQWNTLIILLWDCVRAGLGVYLWLFSGVLHDEIIIFSPWPSLAAILTFCLFPAMHIYNIQIYIYVYMLSIPYMSILYRISTCNILNLENSRAELINIINLGICCPDCSRLDGSLRAQCCGLRAIFVSYLYR